MNTEERVLDFTEVYDGKIIKVRKYSVELPDGKTTFREEVMHSGGACALAVEDGSIYFVSQFRLAAKKDLLEIPAGKLNEGESPEDAARRELAEEVGIKAEKMKLIASVYVSPGYTNEKIFIYHCERFSKTEQDLDDGEFLNVVKIPVETAFEMLERGEITDAKTVIALLYLKNTIG